MKMPGGGTEPGEPELPAMRYFFIIPPDRDVTSVTVISFNEHDLKGNFIVFPTQEDRPTTEEPPPEIWSEPKSEIYSSSTPFPGEIVRIMQHGYLDGGTRIVSISVSPLRYIPDMGVLRLVDNITFTLNLGGSSSQPSVPAVRHTKDQKVYDSILDGLVLNPEDMATWQQKPTLQNSYSFVTQDHFFPYVIITAPEFAPQMEEFVQWKRTKGIYAGVVTTDWIYANYTGDEVSGIYDEAGKLRAYLQDAWQNYGTCWVLLAGDETHLPLRYGYRTWNYSSNYSEYIIPTDFYFSDYNSNWDDDHGRWGLNIAEIDPWPETFIGRIPIGSTTEFRDWYDKQRLYVDDPGNGDPAYLNKVLLTQEDQMQWEATYAPDGQAGIIAANHLSANFIPEILEEDLGPCIDPTSPHGSDLVDKLDEGFGIVTHNNHGSGISITVGTGEGWELVTHPNGDTVSVYHCYTWSPWWGFKREWSTNGTSSGFNHLAETDRYSFVYSIGCNNATFDDELTPNEGHLDWAGPSFSEMYLENYRKGAIAFAGNTRYGKVFSSFNLEKRFFDLITNWGNYGDFPHTKAGVAEGVHKAANADWYLLYSHNLFGDPELDIWNNTPLLFTNVTYSAFMVGPLEYSVQTNIPYSTVSISKPDEDY
ncbi:MAG: hypothetical protein K9N22_08705, partial [Candidatus Marinimicrobia bacterium]|nr:hypothetical protein [Candidatus Neomarinimicrobiota bacterium]